ncbi:hypothetical protein BDV28DRAFT_158861 [Aspergillus coremiiformis]|uniref:Uncharacterized protein n=1 Tax=Aspergillus coremiiformis TaxID=138285 RepID=A0A5N6Z5K8_9EURO|nr:hypothetical protein BDV28DRAFT_158861 [Aspergillus coremiiformis]
MRFDCIAALLTNADNGRWNQLSYGTNVLIRNCDVRQFRQPSGRAMVESQRAFFVRHGLRQPCFLAQSPWREFLWETEETVLAPVSCAAVLRSKLCNWLVDVPVLLQEISEEKLGAYRVPSASFLLIILENAMSIFTSQLSEDSRSATEYTIKIAKRHQNSRDALEYVRKYSTVAAKPLEF